MKRKQTRIVLYIMITVCIMVFGACSSSNQGEDSKFETESKENSIITPEAELPTEEEQNLPSPSITETENKGNINIEEKVLESIKEKETEENKIVKIHKIAIDAGHQQQGNSEQEAIGPGAAETKAKVASGTRGISTEVPEYQLTLEVAMKLKEELMNRGYEVIMIRESNDVNISNAERAEIANNSGAEAFVRIHANGSENQDVSGILTISPTENNPYCSSIYSESKMLSEAILNAMVEQTGAENKGVMETDNMSGINWCQIPVSIVEMGFMSNPEEDELMQTEEYQNKLVIGIADGIEGFFE